MAAAVTLSLGLTAPALAEEPGASQLAQGAGDGTSAQPTDATTSTTVHAAPIVVTGEKLERPYLDTFTSTGLVTEDDIEIYGLNDLSDGFNTMANVRWFATNQGNNGFQIRGLNADGVTQPANSAPLISVIVDGVTQSAEALKRGARGLWDVDQVEVLRGPQSTLQGRNALGGAVIIETNDPTYNFEAAAKGGLATDDRYKAAAMVNAPIVDGQAALRLSAEYFEEEKDIDIQDPANAPLNEDEYWNFRGKLLLEPKAFEDFSFLLSASRVHDKPAANAVSPPDFFDRNFTDGSLFTEFREMDLYNFSGDAAYDFGRFKLRSVTALHTTDLAIESAPASAPFFVREDARKDFDFTQDIRIEIPQGNQRLSGVAGLFYGNFDQNVDSFISAVDPMFGPVVVQDGEFERETETFAVYTDLRYRVLPWASVLGGLRLQRDKVRNRIDIISFGAPSAIDQDATFDVALPKIGVAFDLTETQTIAVTASRGYRQGFTEAEAGTGDAVEVDPEYVWTYELAYRLSAAGGRLNLGANLFFNDYQDQQVTLTDPVLAPLSNTRNAAESTSYGAEIEGRYVFDNGFRLFGAVGLLQTEFGKFEDASCAPSGGDCKGNEFPEAPAFTASLGGAYYSETGLFAAASGEYTDGFYSNGDINNTSLRKIDDRFVANIRAGYQTENVTFAVYADNVFDEDYLTGIDAAGATATIGDGRQIGVELSVKF